MVGLLSLDSCCGRPKMRNSVLEGLRDRKLDDIHAVGHISYSIFKVSDVMRGMFQAVSFKNSCIDLHVWYTVGKLIQRSNLRQIYFAPCEREPNTIIWNTSHKSVYSFFQTQNFGFNKCYLWLSDNNCKLLCESNVCVINLKNLSVYKCC